MFHRARQRTTAGGPLVLSSDQHASRERLEPIVHPFWVTEKPEGPRLDASAGGEAHDGCLHDARINSGDRLPVRVRSNPAADAVETRKRILFRHPTSNEEPVTHARGLARRDGPPPLVVSTASGPSPWDARLDNPIEPHAHVAMPEKSSDSSSACGGEHESGASRLIRSR